MRWLGLQHRLHHKGLCLLLGLSGSLLLWRLSLLLLLGQRCCLLLLLLLSKLEMGGCVEELGLAVLELLLVNGYLLLDHHLLLQMDLLLLLDQRVRLDLRICCYTKTKKKQRTKVSNSAAGNNKNKAATALL